MYYNIEFFITFLISFITIFILKVLFNKTNYKGNSITLFIDSIVTLIILIFFVFIYNYIGFRDVESRVSDVGIQMLILMFSGILLPYIYIKIKKKLIIKVGGKPTDMYGKNEFLILFISVLITLVISAII